MRRSLVKVTLGAITLLAVACGDGVVDFFADDGPPPDPARVVGGACDSSGACAPGSLCLTGEDFPSGTCALPCQLGSTCPNSTLCVKLDDEGGFLVPSACLPACVDQADCRAGYECRSVHQVPDQVEVRVCGG